MWLLHGGLDLYIFEFNTCKSICNFNIKKPVLISFTQKHVDTYMLG